MKEKLKLVRRYIGGQYVPAPEAFRSRTSFKASLLNWVKRYRLCAKKGLERLKVEMYYGEEGRYPDYGSLKKAIVEYIDWYNSSRLKEYLHWKSPQEALSDSGTL